MDREVTVVIERDARGFYVASVLTPRGCHTQACSLDALMERIKEAIPATQRRSSSVGTFRFFARRPLTR
jgi:hypothetical protein